MEEATPELSHEGFWDTKEPLNEVHFDIHDPEVQVGSLKRLGEPTFWTLSKSLTKHLEFLYVAMSKKAGE